jgi:hypothetical protein
MRIIKIEGIETWVKDNKRHSRTHAILESGEEAKGYGSDFAVGDDVSYFFQEEWNTIKMIRKTTPRSPEE